MLRPTYLERSRRLSESENPCSSTSSTSSSSTVNQNTATKITSLQTNSPNNHSREDPSLNIPENVIKNLNKAMQTLTVGPNKVSDESVREAIDDVVSYIHSTNNAMYGEGTDDSQYFGTHGRVFVVEEVDDEFVKENKLCKGYRTCAGEIAGLSKSNAPYRRRIHLLIDCKSGVYGCDNLLRDNYHYQIKQSDLKEYLYDAFTKARANICVAGQNDGGTVDDAGIRTIPPTGKTSHDCIIYTAATPFAVANTSTYRGTSDEGGVSPGFEDRPCFFAINGTGAKEVEHLTSRLRFSKFHRYLNENVNSVGDGAAARNHKSSIEHGFSFLNCTNTERTELHNLPSPQLTKSNYTRSGVEEGETMAESCARNMACMTNLLDCVTRLMLPGKGKYFNDDKRNKIYANTIHEHNRGEHFVAAMSNGTLGCHTDRHNDRGGEYGMNLTAWEYIRDYDVVSPKEEGYYVRVNQGMYGRNICETTYKRANQITLLIEDLEHFMDHLPKEQKEVSSDLLNRMDGDLATHYKNTNVIARKPHVDKAAGYYSFFVTTLGRWISKRRIAGDHVCFDELTEALLTAVRWTPSPSAWAYVFETITSDKGFELEIPNELALSEDLRRRVVNGKLPLTKSHQSPLPLFVQYILGSIQLLGGVAKGSHVRFQPSVGLTEIDFEMELASLKQLKTLLARVVDDTHKTVGSIAIPQSDSDTIAKAEQLRPITHNFIRDASLPVAQGGVLGFGMLISHHYVMILALGGWIDCAHSLNTIFSKGNGTADFLLIEYNLNVGKNPNIIDAVSGSSLFDAFGVNRRIVAENSTCKMGSGHREGDPRARQNYDTLDLGEDSFIPQISSGTHQALFHDGSLKVITSGTVGKPLTETDVGVLNLTVVRKKKIPKITKGPITMGNKDLYWWNPSYSLSQIVNGRAMVKSMNINKKKNRKRKKQSVSGLCSAECSSSKDKFGNCYGHPSRKYGFVPRRNQKNEQRLAQAAEYMCRCVVQERTLSGILGYNCPSNLKSFVEHFTGLELGKLKALQDEVDKNLGSLDDTEDVNELKCKRAADDIFTSVLKHIRFAKSSSATKRSSARKRLDNPVDYFHEDDGSVHDTKLDPTKMTYPLRCREEFDINDPNDSPYDDPENHQLTQMIKVLDRRSLPTSTAIDILCDTYGRTYDLGSEVKKLATKNRDGAHGSMDIEPHLHDIKCYQLDINGYQLYNFSVNIGNTLFSSNDKVFSSGSKRKSTQMSLTVGRHIDRDGTAWYLTKRHAQFALWMVIMMAHEGAIEEKFLPHSDVCVILPSKKYAFDIQSHDSTKEALPICCMLRSGNEIVALDCGIIRFNELFKWRYIDTGNGNTVDQLTHYYNETSGKWEEIELMRKRAYNLMAQNNTIAPTIIGKASRNVLINIPRNTKEVSRDKHGYLTAIVSNNDGTRRDKYWFYKNSKFRSSKEVEFFKEMILEFDGDVDQAERQFKERLKHRNEANRKQHQREITATQMLGKRTGNKSKEKRRFPAKQSSCGKNTTKGKKRHSIQEGTGKKGRKGKKGKRK